MADKKAAAGGDSLPEVEVMLKGLLTQPGVEGFLVFNEAGIPLKWTNSGFIKPGTPNSANPIPPAIVHHTALAHDLTHKAKASCKRLLGELEGDLALLRLHSKHHEYIIAPGEAETLMVLQKAHSAALLPLVKVADAEQLAALAATSKGSDASKKK